jgi:hypothetical protein
VCWRAPSQVLALFFFFVTTTWQVCPFRTLERENKDPKSEIGYSSVTEHLLSMLKVNRFHPQYRGKKILSLRQ